ncbi:MAG: WcaF family extracellular polysaccharide biosynthesis acetyltransferase [Ferruginibacter sp.]
MKVNLGAYDNSWYNPGHPLKRLCWYVTSFLFFRNPVFPFYGFKVFLLRIFGARIGQGVIIKPGVHIKYPWMLQTGDHVWIGEGAWIDNLANVTLGNNVCISQGAMLLCGNHNYSKPGFDLIVKEIIMEEGSWSGAKSIVTGGVKMGSHAILTAGSVATKDLEAWGIYQGNPALKIKERTMETPV